MAKVPYAPIPHLADFTVVEHDCSLIGDDGRQFRLNISKDILEGHLRNRRFGSLADICRAGNSEIWPTPIQMMEPDWQVISQILLESPQAQPLVGHHDIWKALQLPYSDLLDLPYRLYGGFGFSPPTFYISQPFNFRAHPYSRKKRPWYDRLFNRKGAWYYALLSAPGGNLFKTHVNTRTSEVEILAGIKLNHFVETVEGQSAEYVGA